MALMCQPKTEMVNSGVVPTSRDCSTTRTATIPNGAESRARISLTGSRIDIMPTTARQKTIAGNTILLHEMTAIMVKKVKITLTRGLIRVNALSR